MVPGIAEEDEDMEMDEDMEVEEVDQFGPVLGLTSDVDAAVDDSGEAYTEPVSPLSPLPPTDEEPMEPNRTGSAGVPLTAEALARKQEEDEKLEALAQKTKQAD